MLSVELGVGCAIAGDSDVESLKIRAQAKRIGIASRNMILGVSLDNNLVVSITCLPVIAKGLAVCQTVSGLRQNLWIIVHSERC